MNRTDWRINKCPGSNSDASDCASRLVFGLFHCLCPHCGRSCVIRRGKLIEHKPKANDETSNKNPHKQLGPVLTRSSKAKSPANERPHSSKRKENTSRGFVDPTAI